MPLTREQEKRLKRAHETLRDPEVFQRFYSLWGENPEEALHLVNLSKKDYEDFRAYVEGLELPDAMRPWFFWWPLPL